MKLNYKEVVGAKKGALTLVNKMGWQRTAVVLANQRNIPGLCVLLHGLDYGIDDLVRGRQWQCPSTVELLESEFPSDPDDLANEILRYLYEYYGKEVN